MKHLITVVVVLLAGGWNLCPSAKAASRVDVVPGEFIVKLKPLPASVNVLGSRSMQVWTTLLQQVPSIRQVTSVEPFRTAEEFLLVRTNPDATLRAPMRLESSPWIEYIEPNAVYHALELPNDPDFQQSWSLKNTGQTITQEGRIGADIHVTEVWDRGIRGSRNILVAVIDTGVQWDHPDLKDNIFTNSGESGEKANNGIDDDGNGFVDDVHGFNFFTHTADSRDDMDHGTHCSGIIGSVGNNGIGTTGVNWEVSILPVKFMDRRGYGTTQGAIEAINYARMMGARIMNNSWGGDPYSQALLETIQKTRDAGILFVAAAGNDEINNDEKPEYPASYPVSNVISVAASDNRDELVGFSNYGAKSVHVAAPGLLIHSTVNDGTWYSYSGTSMAAPHVAGIAALMLSREPDLTPEQIIDRLIRSCDHNYNLKRKVKCKGRVNAYNAVFNITPPSLDPDDSLWVDHPYRLESEHPYSDKMNWVVPVRVPGAAFIRLHFEKIATEEFDRITIETPEGEVLETLSGELQDYYSENVKGDTIMLRFKTDMNITRFGFIVDRVQIVPGAADGKVAGTPEAQSRPQSRR